jgi:DNA-binding NarL/FixJ family response regulator
MRKAKILLADDHAIVLDGLSRLLEAEFEVIGKAGDGRAMLDLADSLKPDIIVADVSMPFLSGIEAARQLKEKGTRIKVIFLSMHADVELASEALRVGAAGYVLKHSAAETLSMAIHEALAGRVYVSPRIADGLASVRQVSGRSDRLRVALTRREREVLQLVAEGRTIQGIANILKIACRTVVFHKANVMDKVGVRTTAELTCYAIQCGLLTAPKVGFSQATTKKAAAAHA